MKKLIALLIACILTVALGVTAFAAESTTGTITINPPTGLTDTAETEYKIYKVFDASGNGEAISYRLMSGKTTAPAGFTVDGAGNVSYAGGKEATSLTQDDINAIAAYVEGDTPVATLTAKGSEPVTSENLPNGYYFITTTTGSLVTINSTNPNAEVKDKNSIPVLNKAITGVGTGSYDEDGKKALAEVGSIVNYEVTITVGKGAKGYIFHDKMDAGLSYNNNATVTGEGVTADKYTVKETPDEGDTITITFADGIKEGTAIKIAYTATVTSDALQDNPAKNTATISYGNNHEYTTVPEKTEVYNAKFTVSKTDQDNKPLAGAGFVIKNAAGKFYKITKTTQGEDDAVVTTSAVTWVDDIKDATEYMSNDKGEVAPFTGLADGTYTLSEKTTPAGYNSVADSTFEIKGNDYSAENLKQAKTIINQSGAVLPSTGGMGTTIFYLFGSLLVLGAAVLMVTRRRVTI